MGLVLARGSLAVQHVGSASHMAIDAGTAAALELIHPLRVGTCSAKLSGLSLFKWVLARMPGEKGGAQLFVVASADCTLSCRI